MDLEFGKHPYSMVDAGVNFGSSKIMSNRKVKQIIDNAYNIGVDKFISVSHNIEESKRNFKLSTRHPGILYHTVGCFGKYAKSIEDIDFDYLEKSVLPDSCIGVSMGLDFTDVKKTSSKESQIELLCKLIELSQKYNKVMFIYYRKSFHDLTKLLKSYKNLNVIIHCFDGTLDEAIYFKKKKYKLGITCSLSNWKEGKHLRDMVQDKRITLSDLVVQSNTPWGGIMTKRSVPQDTTEIVHLISRLKKIKLQECSKTLRDNTMMLLCLND